MTFAQVMRENAVRIHPKVQGRLVDTCGTGGDTLKTFNVSTAAAFVIAGADVPIAKHGNRSVTSRSGSADVLEQLGLNLQMSPKAVEAAIEEIGVGFMFAPAFHPAMKYAVAPRKEVGIRTIFNLLGPLTNPACANAQLLGVYDTRLRFLWRMRLKVWAAKKPWLCMGLTGWTKSQPWALPSFPTSKTAKSTRLRRPHNSAAPNPPPSPIWKAPRPKKTPWALQNSDRANSSRRPETGDCSRQRGGRHNRGRKSRRLQRSNRNRPRIHPQQSSLQKTQIAR